MDKLRTDLALEARELWQRSAAFSTNVEGVLHAEQVKDGIPVTTVEIRSEEGAKAIGKPKGRYVTLSLEDVQHRDSSAFPRTVRIIAEELGAFLKGMDGGRPVLVAGLGNRAMTADAIGPLTVERITVTNHVKILDPPLFQSLRHRAVAAVSPGVLGQTGIESALTVRQLVGALHPRLVIVVDALAARSTARLCKTVQLSTGGIAPGSGVGNDRPAFTRESLGAPVLAIGVPMVVDSSTLVADALNQAGIDDLPPALLSVLEGGKRRWTARWSPLPRSLPAPLTGLWQRSIDGAGAPPRAPYALFVQNHTVKHHFGLLFFCSPCHTFLVK